MLQGKKRVPSTDLMTIQPVLVNKHTYAPSMINSWRTYTVWQTCQIDIPLSWKYKGIFLLGLQEGQEG